MNKLKEEAPIAHGEGGRGSEGLHWVPMPMPMPTHAHGLWVGTGAMLLFMGGHWFCASLHPTPNRSQTSWMQELR